MDRWTSQQIEQGSYRGEKTLQESSGALEIPSPDGKTPAYRTGGSSPQNLIASSSQGALEVPQPDFVAYERPLEEMSQVELVSHGLMRMNPEGERAQELVRAQVVDVHANLVNGSNCN